MNAPLFDPPTTWPWDVPCGWCGHHQEKHYAVPCGLQELRGCLHDTGTHDACECTGWIEPA